MNKRLGLLVFTSLLLTACGDWGRVSSAPDPFSITPSRQPIIVTATPIIVVPSTSATLPPPPSLTSVLDQTPSPSATATFTAQTPFPETFTPSPTTTATNAPSITLLGCDTSLDLTHGMGEVTNAYVTIFNRSTPNLTNICVSLAAADEGRAHPDKTRCVPTLASGFQVTLKLTIDTTYQVNTIVQVSLTSDQGFSASTGGLACQEIGSFKPAVDTLGAVVPIPQ